MIEPRPYKLINKIQNYDWGTKNEKAFIPKLIGIEPVKDLPYGELWIGAHPKASSEITIDNKKYLLNEIIERYPVEILSIEIAERFENKLPFLLKVLSASKALSIQTHPNKIQAVHLHGKDNINYPDDNHKPEIAIAIDSLIAIAGFRPLNEIIENINRTPELSIIAGTEIINEIMSEKRESEQKNKIKKLYALLMKRADVNEVLKNVILKIVKRLSAQTVNIQEEVEFLKQYKYFGPDIGLLSFFFFNIINLKSGQAIFTDAGVPHAYIEGNIIECMANSDNVVRAGLTNKFKDVDTLLDILKYDFSKYKILNEIQKKDNVILETDADEFQLAIFEKNKGYSEKYLTSGKPVVILVMEGRLKIENIKNDLLFSEYYDKGESFLTPAILNEFNLICEMNSKYIIVEIP